MVRKNKGFTLVELLAVIVILGIILVIAVPNVLGIINNARNDSFASTAKMMAASARTISATNSIYVPSSNSTGRIIPWAALTLENVSRDVDNGTYDTANSYVVVVKDSTGTMRYFVTLKGSARSVDRKESTSITVDADTTVTATTVSATPVANFGGISGLSVTIEAST